MDSSWESDDRNSLARSLETRRIVLKNLSNGLDEEFEIEGEQGRGGSCIVYRAIVCAGDASRRPILLKEFYPIRFTDEIHRDPTTGALHYEGAAQKNFIRSREKFLRICGKQADFYGRHVDNADELVEVQGMYAAGDAVYTMTRAVGGCSWDKIDAADESLYQILETTASLLDGLKIFHGDELLHGDLKPENVYIFRKRQLHVTILDFGSVQELSDGMLSGDEDISFSEAFAAPEILAIEGTEGIDREDYCACVTTKADLFSVGAILYTRLVGKKIPRGVNEQQLSEKRSAELSECRRREKFGRAQNMSVRVQKELQSFFDGALALNPDERFDLEEMNRRLEQLMAYAAPQRVRLSASSIPARANENFLGRTAELEQLKNFLAGDKQTLFIYGSGGLGKSQLALKLAQELRDERDFFWATFDGDLRQTIMNLQTAPPFSFDEEKPSDAENLYAWNLNCLRSYGSDAALIIDNFDLPPELTADMLCGSTYGDLSQLGLKIIFTCRYRPSEKFARLEIEPLTEDELLNLMRRYYHAEDRYNLLPQLIRAVKFNTLLVEQAARVLEQSWGGLTPSKILALFRKATDDATTEEGLIISRLRTLFDVSVLSERARKIMAHAVLLPTAGIDAAIFLRSHDEIQADKIRILELSGWINKSTDNLLSLHPLIREVCMSEVSKAEDDCRLFLENYYREFSKLSSDDWFAQRLQRADIASIAANLLTDDDGSLAKKAGEINHKEGRCRRALFHYQRLWSNFLADHNNNPDTLEAMALMDKIAQCAAGAGEIDHAIYYEGAALALAEKLLGGERVELFFYYVNMARFYRTATDFKHAKMFYDKAFRFCETHSIDPYQLVWFYKDYARFCIVRSQIDEALKYANLAMKILDEHREYPKTMVADVLNMFSFISQNKNDLDGALIYAVQSMRVYQHVKGADHPLTAQSYIRLGHVLIDWKLFFDAQAYLERARKIFEKAYGKNHGSTQQTYFLLKRLEQARKAADEKNS